MYYCQDADMYEKVTSVISWNCPYSFEEMLSENANFRLNNVNNVFSLLMEYGIT